MLLDNAVLPKTVQFWEQEKFLLLQATALEFVLEGHAAAPDDPKPTGAIRNRKQNKDPDAKTKP